MKSPLVLASQSPRRKKILKHFGVSFRVIKPVEVEEDFIQGESPQDMVRRLALKKALAVSKRKPGSRVLAADTVVALGSKIFGKPRSRYEARNMLKTLGGRGHEVWTGVALVGPGKRKARVYVERTRVFFKPLTVWDISAYLATREPYDKAGAYDIQGTARKWITGWEGSYFNIMGLPVDWVLKQL